MVPEKSERLAEQVERQQTLKHVLTSTSLNNVATWRLALT